MVYLLHFNESYCHAKHYIGFVDGGGEELETRLRQHQAGTGAKLMKVVTDAGIGFELARVWPDGDRNFERHLKNMKKASQYCPICRTSHTNKGG